jgi:hypothetical protein
MQEREALGPHIISFEAFKTKYNKVYHSAREARIRQIVFQKNLKLIESLNKKEGVHCCHFHACFDRLKPRFDNLRREQVL